MASNLNKWSKIKGEHKKICQKEATKIKDDKDKKEGEKTIKTVIEEQFPVINADQHWAWRTWKIGGQDAYNQLTVMDLVTLFPGACQEEQAYFATGGKAKLWAHCQEYVMQQPTIRNMYDFAVKVRDGVTAEIRDSIVQLKDEFNAELKRIEEKVDKNTKEANRIEKSVKINRLVDKELIIYAMVAPVTDWGPEVENDALKFKEKMKDYLRNLVNANDRGRNFIVSCGTIPDKITPANRDHKRYRTIIRTEGVAWDILERAAKSDEHRNKIKPGKNPAERAVGRARWPFQIASMKFNFSSFNGSKAELSRVERNKEDSDWTVVVYPWNDPNVKRIRERSENGGFKDPDGFTEEKHGKILKDLSLSY